MLDQVGVDSAGPHARDRADRHLVDVFQGLNAGAPPASTIDPYEVIGTESGVVVRATSKRYPQPLGEVRGYRQ